MAWQPMASNDGGRPTQRPHSWHPYSTPPTAAYARAHASHCGMFASASFEPTATPSRSETEVEEDKPRKARLGFFNIGKTIGRGNYAIVKLADHRVLKNEVAIKIIDKTKLDAENLHRVYREIEVLKRLDHPYIIKLYQVMETEHFIYIVTEYADGGEVFDLVQRSKRLKEDMARKLFWEMLTALEYCHNNGVVHRDIKAENLLLSNGRIKLADFGFSNFFDKNYLLQTFCGSPPYAAPEIFAGVAYKGSQTDVWSLGVTLYVLLTGSMPFKGNGVADLKRRIFSGFFRVPYFVSTECENLLRRMLCVDPSKRITLEEIKEHSWMKVGNHEQRVRQELQAYRIATSETPITASIKVLKDLGIPNEKLEQSLNSNAYDHTMCMFHLLMERYRKQNFDPILNDIQEEAKRMEQEDSVDSGTGSMDQSARRIRPTLSSLRGHKQFQTTDTVSSLDETRSTVSRQSTINTIGSIDEGVDFTCYEHVGTSTIPRVQPDKISLKSADSTTSMGMCQDSTSRGLVRCRNVDCTQSTTSDVLASPSAAWTSNQSLYDEVVPSLDNFPVRNLEELPSSTNIIGRQSSEGVREKMEGLSMSDEQQRRMSMRTLPRKVSFSETGEISPQVLLNWKKSVLAEQQMNGDPHLAQIRLQHFKKRASNKKRLQYLRQQSQQKSTLLESSEDERRNATE